MVHFRSVVAGLALAFPLLLTACLPRPPAPAKLTLKPVAFDVLAGWSEDDIAAAVPAFLKSCQILLKQRADAPIGNGGLAGKAGDWREPCMAAAALASGDGAAARQFFEAYFVPLEAGNNGEREGLFTGYYEPELRGARQRDGAYTVPLLKRPPDLVMVDLGQFRPAWRGERIAGRVVDGRLRPYESRAEIEGGALDRYHLELLWVDDPVDAFFLQVQG